MNRTALSLIAVLAAIAANGSAIAQSTTQAGEKDASACRFNLVYCQAYGESYGRSNAPRGDLSKEIKTGCSEVVNAQWLGIYGERCGYEGHAAAGEGGRITVKNTVAGLTGQGLLQCIDGKFKVHNSSECRVGSRTAAAEVEQEQKVSGYFSPSVVEAGEAYSFNWKSLGAGVENVLLKCSDVDGARRMVFSGSEGTSLLFPRSLHHVGQTLWCEVIPYGPLDEQQRATIAVNHPGQVAPLAGTAVQTIQLKTNAPSETIIVGSEDNGDGSYLVFTSDGGSERRLRTDANGNLVRFDGTPVPRSALKPVVRFNGRDYPIPN